MFDKLLCALTSFDLSSNVAFDMEWLMLHGPLFAQISGGFSLGVLQHLTWMIVPFSSLTSSFLFLFFFLVVDI